MTKLKMRKKEPKATKKEVRYAKRTEPRIDSKEYIPMVPFKEHGTTMVEVLLDDNLSNGEALFFLHLSTVFPRNRFEGRRIITRMFPNKYRSKIIMSKRFQALVNYGYLKIERVLQSESYYILAPLLGIKE